MEPEIFSEFDPSKVIHKNMKQELLDMEARLADEANAERENALKREEAYKKLNEKANLVFGAEASIWAILIYYIHGIFKRKNKSKNNDVKYLRDLPDDSSPALVGGVMTKSVNDNEILATIVDLIRRKVLTLETSDKNTIITLTGGTDKLSAQEKAIIDIYINDFGDGKSLDLKSFGFFSKVPMSTARKFEKWSSYIIAEMNRKGLVYENIGCGMMFIFMLLSAVFAFGGIIQAALTENPLFIFGIPLGIVLFFSAGTAKYPSKKIADFNVKWQAFKNFLSDYSQLEEAKITSIHLWEQYFVYVRSETRTAEPASRPSMEISRLSGMEVAGAFTRMVNSSTEWTVPGADSPVTTRATSTSTFSPAFTAWKSACRMSRRTG